MKLENNFCHDECSSWTNNAGRVRDRGEFEPF